MTTTSMPVTTSIPAPRSAEAERLLARLDDPATAAALHELLDNVEMLSMLVGMADGLVRRSEDIAGNIAGGIAEVRLAATEALGGTGDLKAVGAEINALLPVLRAGAPALNALASSRMAAPETISALDGVSKALVEGLNEAPSTPTGLRGLFRLVRDPDTLRGLGVSLSVARALGRRSRA